MASRRIVLASASPARLRLLRAAGIDPEVVVSGVDEEGLDDRDTDHLVATLAQRKAAAVVPAAGDAIVVAADSALELGGRSLGKPHTPEVALARWRELRGSTGVLATGHHVVDARSGRSRSAVARTTVTFAHPDDTELAAYVATGEPLEVAGAFTLDGYGSAYVECIEGDPSNVVGLSIPLLRRMLGELDVCWSDLWR